MQYADKANDGYRPRSSGSSPKEPEAKCLQPQTPTTESGEMQWTDSAFAYWLSAAEGKWPERFDHVRRQLLQEVREGG